MFRSTVWQNLCCLTEILRYTAENGMLFFRVGSGLIPFASHPILDVDWVSEYSDKLIELGEYCMNNNLRLSFHPDQFCLINAIDEELIERSIWELEWHCQFFDAMKLDDTHKVQIHVGGVYGNKQHALDRWCHVYNNRLSEQIKRRLVIENDDKLFTVRDCLYIHEHSKLGGINGCGVPILFDNLHHACLHNNESMTDALQSCLHTWTARDGIPLTDYSTQDTNKLNKLGAHTEVIDDIHFQSYIQHTTHLQFDIMLEIKGKERSALLALPIAANVRGNVDIDFHDYAPAPVYIHDDDTGQLIELHKIDDIKNRKKQLGKAEQTKKLKLLELHARQLADDNNNIFDRHQFYNDMKVMNRQKGVEKRQRGSRIDNMDYTHLTGQRIRNQVDSKLLLQQRMNRQTLVDKCDVESANVDRALVNSRIQRFIESGGSSTAKIKKKSIIKHSIIDNGHSSVKNEIDTMDSGELEFHLTTNDVNQSNDSTARIKRNSTLKVQSNLGESKYSDNQPHSSIDTANDNVDIDTTQQTTPVIAPIKQSIVLPRIPRVKQETVTDNNDDEIQHTTPAIKRNKKQRSNVQ